MEERQDHATRTISIVMIIALVGKVLGLYRDHLLAVYYGTGMAANAFNTASRIPRVFFDAVFASAISACFIPVFSEYLTRKGREPAFRFAGCFITVMGLLSAVLSVLGILFAGPLVSLFADGYDAQTAELAVSLTRVMFPTVLFTGVAFSFVGVLQSLGEFNVPALISVVSNLVIILYYLTLDQQFGIYGLAVAFLVGWFLQAAVQVPSLRRLGFRYIFDTNFTADLTIMEEGSEFFRRLQRGDMAQYPMFTSCCPGWVRFLKGQYPQLTGQLSTAKSPQQMFGSLTKSWLAQKLGVEPEKIFCVSIMPCVAKKAESELPTMATEHGPDVDLVLTTREFVRMLRADKIIPSLLPEEGLDDPMGVSTGAGVIFGTTGGVMEAALRSASFLLTGQNPDPEAFSQLREGPDLREATYDLAGTSVRCAVVSGLGNTRKLLDRILAGKIHYDFVEVMACPGGCVGGGGQPIDKEDRELGGIRGDRLHQLDGQAPLRFSHENPQVQALYREFLGKPLSEISEYLLHSDHTAWAMPNQRETE